MNLIYVLLPECKICLIKMYCLGKFNVQSLQSPRAANIRKHNHLISSTVVCFGHMLAFCRYWTRFTEHILENIQNDHLCWGSIVDTSLFATKTVGGALLLTTRFSDKQSPKCANKLSAFYLATIALSILCIEFLLNYKWTAKCVYMYISHFWAFPVWFLLTKTASL